tara:strand:+ start:5703 stop:6311 length:609 start_codon:yes stop_codon:yes gene_type:complete
MKPPIEVFSNWVKLGKDDGMEKNHFKPVMKMINLYQNKSDFTSIDAGCGNGWLVRYLSKIQGCQKSIGIDGSFEMIKKAKSIDKKNNYFCSDLLNWIPKKKVDVVFSMEVFYYFKNPQKLINHICDNWIKSNGKLIMGIDHYFENIECHNWKNKVKVDTMELIKIKDWLFFFNNSGLKDVKKHQFYAKKRWKGTLVVEGTKI